MRIIGLVEADFNCTLKILYSNRLMENTETAKTSPYQWGGQKNRDAPTCATCGLLSFEFARIMKKTIIACSADAASCFDRVCLAYASVLCTKKRMSKSCYKCASQVVRKLRHKVKTSDGGSANSYRQEDGDVELTASPKGLPTLWTPADSSKTTHPTVDMYVDDATIYVGCGDHEESFPCTSGATDDDSTQQHSMQLHESSLEAAKKIANVCHVITFAVWFKTSHLKEPVPWTAPPRMLQSTSAECIWNALSASTPL